MSTATQEQIAEIMGTAYTAPHRAKVATAPQETTASTPNNEPQFAFTTSGVLAGLSCAALLIIGIVFIFDGISSESQEVHSSQPSAIRQLVNVVTYIGGFIMFGIGVIIGQLSGISSKNIKGS